MSKDLHSKPFDEETKVKLSIFKDYLNEWAPVFFQRNYAKWKRINIFDFFAGPGYDSTGYEGSPLIIINNIKGYSKQISDKKLEVNIVFNEKIEKKYKLLSKVCSNFTNVLINIKTENLKFIDAFEKYKPMMSNCANLLFLDQNGIKQITKEVFKDIIDLQGTDFLFFISSSYLRRFITMEPMKALFDINPEEIKRIRYSNVHRFVCELYKRFIPKDKDYYLTPFTIKKGSNIYGLIFGSSHILGIEKFLKVCWKKDPLRGEANFDIDEENIDINSPSFFEHLNKSSKLKSFEKELEAKILNGEIRNNKEIILYSFGNGFLIPHASGVIKNMVRNGKLPKQKLNLSHKVYKSDFLIVDIKLN